MDRRNFIKCAGVGLGLAALTRTLTTGPAYANETADAAIGTLALSDDAWKTRLTPEQYAVLRKEGTEPPLTSALVNEHRVGIFACVACALPLFPSSFKFDSGTGWPSFFDALPGHVQTKTDYKLIAPRTEYHCARCGGHHGHLFKDGPAPTGLRYCNNGAVLTFMPKEG